MRYSSRRGKKSNYDITDYSLTNLDSLVEMMVYLPPEIRLLIMSFGGIEVPNLVSDKELLQEIHDHYPNFQLEDYLQRLVCQTSERARNIIAFASQLHHFYLYRSNEREAYFVAEGLQPLNSIPELGDLYMCPIPGFIYSGRFDYSATLFEELGLLAQLSNPLEREQEGNKVLVKPRTHDITLHSIVCACWCGVPLDNYYICRDLFACKKYTDDDKTVTYYLE